MQYKVVLLITLSIIFCQLWRPLSVRAAAFPDVEQHWARVDIEKMASHGVLAGYPDGQFRPQQFISRAEFTVLLVRINSDNLPECGEYSGSTFYDVNTTDWFYNDVMKLARAGIVHGTGDGLFQSYQPVQRQEAAQMLWALMSAQEWAMEAASAEAILLSDEQDISEWARMAVNALIQQKFFSGYPDGSFGPTHPLTRAEACIILNRVNNYPIPVLQPVDQSPPIPASTSGHSSSHSPDYSPPAAAEAMSNYLECQVRVIN